MTLCADVTYLYVKRIDINDLKWVSDKLNVHHRLIKVE
jgi:hypothetical protein